MHKIGFVLALAILVALIGASGTDAKKGEVPIVLGCIDFNQDDDCSDRDGDGWIGHIESAAGSNYADANSTPEHGLVDEQTGSHTCSDRVDNDGDGRSDRADEGCRVTCHDYTSGLLCNDRDRDGRPKYVEDLYRSDPNDASSTPETLWLPDTCTDGIDNDSDGLIDDDDEDGCRSPDVDDCIDFSGDPDCLPF